MDISSLSNASIANKYNTVLQEQNKTNSFQSKLEEASKNGSDEELMTACKSFESYFLNLMFKEMRNTVNSSEGFLAKSSAEKMYQDMLDEQLSNKSTDAGGIGLAAFMYKQMKRENESKPIG